MKNLQSVLDERKNLIDEVEKKREIEKQVITNETFHEIQELEDQVQKVKDQKQSKLGKVETEYNKLSQEITDKYLPKASRALGNSLEQDHQILQEKNKYSNVSSEEIQNAIAIQRTISKLPPGSKKVILQGLKEEVRKLTQEKDLAEMQENRKITSYIATNGETCYVLTPLREKGKSDGLVDALQGKLIDCFTKAKKMTVDPGHTVEIQNPSADFYKGFLVFKIDSTEANYVARGLLQRLNNEKFTPDQLKENGITHGAEKIEYAIVSTFLKTPDKRKHSAGDHTARYKELCGKSERELTWEEVQMLDQKYATSLKNKRQNYGISLDFIPGTKTYKPKKSKK